MPIMPRPSKKARQLHRKLMPFSSQDEDKVSEKKRQKQDRQIAFDIQQNISR